MAWIKSHQNLSNHPKVLKLCNRTNKNKAEIIGYLHLFWWWVLDYAEDGDLSKFKNVLIIEGLKIQDLKDCGFIDNDEKVHDWIDFAGEFLRLKYHTNNPKKYKKIVRKYKGVIRSTLSRDKVQLDKTDKIDKIRLDKTDKIETPNKSPEFLESWKSFLEMRKSIKSAPTDNAQALLLKKLESLSSEESMQIKIINQSTMNSWKGFFELKETSYGKSRQDSPRGTGKYANISKTVIDRD